MSPLYGALRYIPTSKTLVESLAKRESKESPQMTAVQILEALTTPEQIAADVDDIYTPQLVAQYAVAYDAVTDAIANAQNPLAAALEALDSLNDNMMAEEIRNFLTDEFGI